MENVTIHVAGNPSAYPIEYYDAETGSFQGMIPDLLAQFSFQSGIEVEYYEPGPIDRREELADERLVEVLSGCNGTEVFQHAQGEEVVLLETVEAGEKISYKLLLTGAAPDGLKEELENFLTRTSQEARVGTLVEAAQLKQPMDLKSTRLAMWGMAIAILVLVFAILSVLRRYFKRVSGLIKEKEADALTGVGNREHLERAYKDEIHERNKTRYCLFYFYVDTEHIDRIYGRAQTDEYLRSTASVLKGQIGEEDILARISDSGFVILRPSEDEEEERHWFRPALKRIKSITEGEVQDDSQKIAIGIYRLKQEDNDLNQIIFNAERGAQFAYQKGVDFVVCTDDVLNALDEERKLQKEVRQGLKNQEFQLYIQFYLEAATERIVGGECLSRWNHPEKGLLMPSRFIPFMEREHLISQLDFYVMEKACDFLEKAHQDGKDNFSLSCNFSRETASTEDFIRTCEGIINRYSFPRDLLIIEITEGTLPNYTEKMRDAMFENIIGLRALGLCVILNDFGEGFTSFVGMQDYPLDGFKLDQRLISGIGTAPGESSLSAMIQVCHELDITAVAVGVETAEQAAFLRERHCDVVQGFHFYRPMPQEEVYRRISEEA